MQSQTKTHQALKFSAQDADEILEFETGVKMQTIIYKTVVVNCFEQFSATIVNQMGEILHEKILWSQQAVKRWALSKAGLNPREIYYEDHFPAKPTRQVNSRKI